MEHYTSIIIFSVLSLLMIAAAIAAVTSSKIMRATTYLLFVLFGTAGLYFSMFYTFLGATQITVYAGGIVVLFVFVILLIGKGSIDVTHTSKLRYMAGVLASMSGLAITLYIIKTTHFIADKLDPNGVSMRTLGKTIMGTDKYNFVLTFEVLSILLLACMVGAILIARKK
ncbi:MAG: NADH-quinone oxidoreductase subunit J [Bacteroidaceae bacterium]|nr:NADH-quinone oxidoreductase subunit J [Bacteroidaceae bacterium]